MSSYYSTKPRGRGNYSGRNRYGGGGRSGNQKATKQYIHPSKFVRTASANTEAPYESANTFADFEVAPLLKRNIEAKGFVTPSPIQDQVIPIALQGKDVIGVANTGTGKTAAFGIPILHQLIENRGHRVLIMAPTRELAQQINEDFRSYARGGGLFGVLLIGGVPIGPQKRDLRSRPQIIIGTPGRIKDHLEQGTLNLSNVNKVVLDEVDRMLDMGFVNDIRRILEQLPTNRQSLFFSATLDDKVGQLIRQFANEPVTISIKSSAGSESVNQDIVAYSTKEEQIDQLHDILIRSEVEKIIIFDETQRSVERLNKELVARGFSTDAIHGGKTQGQRKRALDKFRTNQVNILVATDVAARGIDVADITHVINYSVPQTYDDYIHRIGRAGRAGRIGHALTFVAAN
jgi:superfamily II DNA/RNA helicase